MKPQPFNRTSRKQVIAAQLLRWRLDLKLTLREVSRATSFGVNQLSCWESGKNTPKADVWTHLRDFYDEVATARSLKGPSE